MCTTNLTPLLEYSLAVFLGSASLMLTLMGVSYIVSEMAYKIKDRWK